ncbi:hypothetical protein [Frankia sp. AgB32]|uniref:hypothetical protein n=1 Tax=Frankia sp. AgB32 TaxID=631119 RepID=UPI00200C7360|nr:hypothetical protein [Frankia sp. AgB32]MCK9893521.1 hypothetical protein [Frankia sp. AgB32]
MLRQLRTALRATSDVQDLSQRVLETAGRHGLTLAADFAFVRDDRETLIPRGAGADIEARTHSHLWDLTDAPWTAVVEPALAALRALSDPDRPQPTGRSSRSLIFVRPGSDITAPR